MRSFLKFLPERLLVFVLLILAIFFLFYAFVFYRDAKTLTPRISSRQNELGRVIALKEEYLRKKVKEERRPEQKTKLSLSFMEKLVNENMRGAKLTHLKPTSLKVEKNIVENVIEMRIEGAALKDVILLTDALEKAGFLIRRFHMNVRDGAEGLIDLHIIVSEV